MFRNKLISLRRICGVQFDLIRNKECKEERPRISDQLYPSQTPNEHALSRCNTKSNRLYLSAFVGWKEQVEYKSSVANLAKQRS